MRPILIQQLPHERACARRFVVAATRELSCFFGAIFAVVAGITLIISFATVGETRWRCPADTVGVGRGVCVRPSPADLVPEEQFATTVSRDTWIVACVFAPASLAALCVAAGADRAHRRFQSRGRRPAAPPPAGAVRPRSLSFDGAVE